MTDADLTHLDLFSGIGGFALAAKWTGFRTIGFCEIDKYCQRVIAKNFLADTAWDLRSEQTKIGTNGQRAWPRCYSDIRELDGGDIGCNVTLLTGGFPCQPFSCAGKRRGKEDDRHLWPEMLRVIKEARPAWVLGENVAGIIGMELDSVLSDLEAEGYASRAFVIPACGVDARHRRNRVWIVAHAGCIDHNGRRGECGGSEESGSRDRAARSGEHAEHVADGNQLYAQRRDDYATENGSVPSKRSFGLQGSLNRRPEVWLPEPDVGRVAHGIPARVDRLRGLGNAIVPQVAYQILKAIAGIERMTSHR